MSSLKRSRPSALLERRVRPRKEEDSEVEEVEDLSEDGDSSASSDASQSGESGASEDEDDSGEDREDASDVESEEEAEPKIDVSQISFGALAKAQASLSSSKKKKSATNQNLPNDDIAVSIAEREAARAKAAVAAAKRANKHAPMEITSKRPVSRKRDFMEVPKIKARDPRFDPIPGMPVMDEVRARRAYAFLDEYRESELKELKAAAKKEKDPRKLEKLKREILSMESKKKVQARKDKERELIEEHRKKEKELVKQGKKPFYLKKSEQKKQLLLDQYAGLSKKKIDHVIERRRKKLAAKEKKDLPFARRGAESE